MKQKLLDNFVVYLIVAVLLMFIGQFIGGLVIGIPVGLHAISSIDDPTLLSDPEAYTEVLNNLPPIVKLANIYLVSFGMWVVLLLWFLKKNNRPLFGTITRKTRGNTVPKFLLGLLIGFALNGLCVLVACLHGDIELTFSGFDPLIVIPAFLMILIQASSEELLCRGYLYQKLTHRYEDPVIAIVGNAALFTFLHLWNNGISVLSLLNIFISGVMFSLFVYYLDSMWLAFGVHTAWNFTQNILFGLPNSGIESPFGIFTLNTSSAKNSFAYNTEFGVEGCILSTTILAIFCVGLILLGRKRDWKPTNIWA